MVPIGSGNCGGQHSAAARDSALHRSDGHVEDGGNLRVVKVGDIAQDHGHPEIFGQRRQGSIDLLPIAQVLDALAGGGVGVVVEVVIGVVVMIAASHHRAASASAKFVEAGVGGNAIGPCAE